MFFSSYIVTGGIAAVRTLDWGYQLRPILEGEIFKPLAELLDTSGDVVPLIFRSALQRTPHHKCQGAEILIDSVQAFCSAHLLADVAVSLHNDRVITFWMVALGFDIGCLGAPYIQCTHTKWAYSSTSQSGPLHHQTCILVDASCGR